MSFDRHHNLLKSVSQVPYEIRSSNKYPLVSARTSRYFLTRLFLGAYAMHNKYVLVNDPLCQDEMCVFF